MSIIGAFRSEKEAASLDKVLMVAIDEGINPVLDFCKENIYPLYINACDGVYSDKPSKNHTRIIEFFKDK